jgi:putative tricarboxylic transport membrane protein
VIPGLLDRPVLRRHAGHLHHHGDGDLPADDALHGHPAGDHLPDAIYTGAGFGGSVPAVLMNIPGTSSAVATTFDGYPMARQGRHNEALGVALAASVLGTLSSYILLLFLIAPVSAVVVLRSAPGDVRRRGLGHAAARLAGRQIGMARTARRRFRRAAGHRRHEHRRLHAGTMGVPWLLDGVPTIPAMMGLLAASQLLNLINTHYLIEDEADRKISFTKSSAAKLALTYPTIILRGATIGVSSGRSRASVRRSPT